MSIFDVLTLIGGLSLFLFGMNVMGNSLEKCAGGSLQSLLAKLTTGKMLGFLTGLGITAVIQSSSATTVMVVGFVNSGLMTLKQAINVIMGANVGTTVTAWILSLSGIDGDSLFVQLLKPTSFTPILALIGLILSMVGKTDRKKDVGMILLGFATLMFGMDTMSSAVSGLKDVPEFRNLMVMFTNPILGVVAGAVLTGIIQSSSASVGILQALATTGQITVGMTIPIIMGQNIGTCVTALLSSVGANKNARRAAVVHLLFNLIGTVIWLGVYCILKAAVELPVLNEAAGAMSIAVAHSAFNILCTALMLPASGLLEKVACKLISDEQYTGKVTELDERLMATPAVAISQCRVVTEKMAKLASNAVLESLELIEEYDADKAAHVIAAEDETDHYEDILGTYLVKLGKHEMSAADNTESARLLHAIGDFERIADHAKAILQSVEEIRSKQILLSDSARAELHVLCAAVQETVDLTLVSFRHNDLNTAAMVEPLEYVIKKRKDQLRSNHVLRLQRGECSVEAGFVWSDLLTSLERVSAHCSNIAGCVIELDHTSLDLHSYVGNIKAESRSFADRVKKYEDRYAI